MASKEAFEDHCWKDVISADDIELYSPYARGVERGGSAGTFRAMGRAAPTLPRVRTTLLDRCRADLRWPTETRLHG